MRLPAANHRSPTSFNHLISQHTLRIELKLSKHAPQHVSESGTCCFPAFYLCFIGAHQLHSAKVTRTDDCFGVPGPRNGRPTQTKTGIIRRERPQKTNSSTFIGERKKHIEKKHIKKIHGIVPGFGGGILFMCFSPP